MSDPKLPELTSDGNFRAKVAAVLGDLDRLGMDAKIFEAKRTVEQQREKVRLGHSKTMNSYHLKRGSDGGSKAADIADRARAWNAPKRFWMILGASAWGHGLGWGGLFGLGAKQKKKLMAALKRLSASDWPDHSSDYETPIGWDGAHVQADFNWPEVRG